MDGTVFGGPRPLFLLLLALVADAALGDWIARVLPDPARLSARLCGVLDRRLNRAERGGGAQVARGLIVVLALVLIAVAVGGAAEWFRTHARSGWVVELVLLLAVLRGRAAWARVRAVRRALDGSSLAAARFEVEGMTRRHVFGLDEHGVARAAVEHAAKSFDRKLVAPAFWYVLLGAPGLLVCAVVEGADAALGHPGVRHERFGQTAARLDDALNAIPARLAAVLLALAAPFLGTASLPAALKAMARDAGRHPSFNMGWPIAATAGALGLALGGPHRDGGVTITEPWIGDGRARATAADIGRVLGLTMLAALLLVLLVGLLTAGVAAL